MLPLRTAIVLGLLTVLAFPSGVVLAQTGGDPPTPTSVTVPDGDKDVWIAVSGQAPQNASQAAEAQFAYLDIKKVVFGEETDTTFQITVYLSALNNPLEQEVNSMPLSVGSYQRSVFFDYGQQHWRVADGRCRGWGSGGGGGGANAARPCLSYLDQNNQWRWAGTPQLVASADQNTQTYTISKQSIYDENHVFGRFGTSLNNTCALATSTYAGFGMGSNLPSATAYDRTPSDTSDPATCADGDFGPSFVFAKGSNGRGNLGLFSLDPTRVSNGGAGTIVYYVDLINKGTKPMQVEMSASELPEDWDVRVPALIRLPAASTVKTPVILTLPSGHIHGAVPTFKLAAKAIDDPGSSADMRLGIYFATNPQPSGHHDGLQWLHSQPRPDIEPPFDNVFKVYNVWMDGNDTDDPNDEATEDPVPAYSNGACNNGGGGGFPPIPCTQLKTISKWNFKLSPTFFLGLDFKTDKDSTASAAFTLPFNADAGSKMIAQFRYCDPEKVQSGGGGGGRRAQSPCQGDGDYGLILAEGSQEFPAISAGTETPFTINMKLVDPKYKYIPYKHGHNVRLDFILEVPNVEYPGVFYPDVTPRFNVKGNRIQFAVNEYHDRIDSALQNVGALSLLVVDAPDKQANPGKTAIFPLDVKNNGANRIRASITISGAYSEWSHPVGEDVVTLEGGATKKIKVAVVVPPGTPVNQQANLIVQVKDIHDEAVVAIQAIHLTVVNEPVIPDEANQDIASKAEAKGFLPGFELVVALAAAGLLALARRRRAV